MSYNALFALIVVAFVSMFTIFYIMDSIEPQQNQSYNMSVKGDTVFVDGKKYELVEVKGYILEEVKEGGK